MCRSAPGKEVPRVDRSGLQGDGAGERPSARGGPPQVPAPRRPQKSRCEGAVSAVRRSAARGTPPGEAGWPTPAARRPGLEDTLRPRGRPRKEAKSRMSLIAPLLLATLYAYPLWEEALVYLGPAVVMLGVLVVRVLSDRRWVHFTYWLIVGAGIASYVFSAATEGWGEFIPHGPSDSVYDPRWPWRFAMTLSVDIVVLLSLSVPWWRKWMPRKKK